jgi:hypothetical protein
MAEITRSYNSAALLAGEEVMNALDATWVRVYALLFLENNCPLKRRTMP